MTRRILTLSIGITLLLSSCYYDTEEELYPTSNGSNCDSVKGAYATEILPVINVQCRSCHNTSFASGGVNLEGFTNIQNAALNGKLIQSLKHESGVSPMPQSAPKLDDCTLKAFEDWKNAGAPNN